MTADDIPHKDLLEIACEAAWYSGGNPVFDRQGYSFEVDEETDVRDVNYRHKPLFETPRDALLYFWEKHYGPKNSVDAPPGAVLP